MKRGRRLGLAAAGASLFAAAAFAEPVPIGRYVELRVGVSHLHPYATSGADARRSGRSRARVAAELPRALWRMHLPRRRLLPPTVLADGTLIVGSASGIDALEPSGKQRWFAPIGELRFSPSITPAGELAAIASGKLFLVKPDGNAREVGLPFVAVGALLVLDSGTLVVPARDGQLHAVAADGTLLSWVAVPTETELVRWTASIEGDSLVAATALPELFFVSLHEGRALAVPLNEPVATSPVVGDDQSVWVLGERGTLFRFGSDGRLRARAALGQANPSDGPALGWDGALRVGLRYGEIACFAPNGQESWRRGLDGAPGPLLIDADDNVLFVSARGTLYAIDRDGDLRFRQALDLRSAGRPVLAADGTIYVVARGGEIEAWR